VILVGETRVTFDAVITEYLNGATADDIAQDFPAISLADVHGTIAYYLRHREDLDRYLDERRQQAAAAERRSREAQPEDLRTRLEDRLRKSGS